MHLRHFGVKNLIIKKLNYKSLLLEFNYLMFLSIIIR